MSRFGVAVACLFHACTCAQPPDLDYRCESAADCAPAEACVGGVCVTPPAADAGSDAGRADAGEPDAGTPDAGETDAGLLDAGEPDAGEPDAGVPDAGLPDAGALDAGSCDPDTLLVCQTDASGAFTSWACVSWYLSEAARRSACLWRDAGPPVFTVKHVPLPAGSLGPPHYGGAILTTSGVIGIPYTERYVLKVGFDGGVQFCGSPISAGGAWQGGVLGREGNVYATPFTATQILRIDPASCATTLLDAGVSGYSGAVLDDAGVLWGMPSTASAFLRFNPATGALTTFPSVTTFVQATALAPSGQVFAFKKTPAGQSQWFDPSAGMPSPMAFSLPNPQDTVVTAVTIADGGIWAPPNTGTNISVVDPVLHTAGSIGLGMLPDYYLGHAAQRGDGHLIVMAGYGGALADIDTATRVTRFIYDPSLDGGVVGNTRWISLTALPDGTLVALPANAPDVLIITVDRPGALALPALLSRWVNKH